MTLGKDDGLFDGLRGKFRGMMKAVFEQGGSELKVSILGDERVQSFIDAHSQVLDSSFDEVDMSDRMRRRLQRSDWVFSGMKAFKEMGEAFPSLVDANGVRKPFEQFLRDVQKIDDTYNKHYLKAEYEFAAASADMAAKWERFMEDGDRYNLQYRTAGDDRVRPEHAALNGVTLPPTDEFWESYYPPNGWRCRCTVVQVRKKKHPATPHDEAMALGEAALGSDIKGMFRFNPGKQERVFPAYNAYTQEKCRNCQLGGKETLTFVSRNEMCQACQLLRQCHEERDRKYAEYLRYLNDPQYKNVEFDEKTGGVKATHKGHNGHDPNDLTRYFENLTKEDLENECQEILFKWGHKAILRNEQIFQANGNQASCLDLELDGVIMDIASITEFNGMYGSRLMNKNNQISRARLQSGDISDSLCLYFHDATMFHEQQLISDIEWYKEFAPSCGSEQRIHHVYVVIRGGVDVIKYDI